MRPEPFNVFDTLTSGLTTVVDTTTGVAGGSFSLTEWVSDMLILFPEAATRFMFNLFIFSYFLAILFLISIVRSVIDINKYSKILVERVEPVVGASGVVATGAGKPLATAWGRVVEHMNSTSESDWKLAILECDIILYDMMETMGYTQDSLGEKLKAVEKSDFTTIEFAWEAHKIRNQIAHEGADYRLTEREARRVIGLYETVFREFELI